MIDSLCECFGNVIHEPLGFTNSCCNIRAILKLISCIIEQQKIRNTTFTNSDISGYSRVWLGKRNDTVDHLHNQATQFVQRIGKNPKTTMQFSWKVSLGITVDGNDVGFKERIFTIFLERLYREEKFSLKNNYLFFFKLIFHRFQKIILKNLNPVYVSSARNHNNCVLKTKFRKKKKEKSTCDFWDERVSAIRWPEYERIPVMVARARTIVTAPTPRRRKKKKKKTSFSRKTKLPQMSRVEFYFLTRISFRF